MKREGHTPGQRKLHKAHQHWLRRLRKGGPAQAQDQHGCLRAATVLRQRKGVVVAGLCTSIKSRPAAALFSPPAPVRCTFLGKQPQPWCSGGLSVLPRPNMEDRT